MMMMMMMFMQRGKKCDVCDGNDDAYLSVGIFDQIYLMKDARVEGHK